MTEQSQSSRFRVLFESALQDYQHQMDTDLANHPLAKQLQNCDSIEAVTSVLQDQARASGHRRIMNSLKGVVSVLYALSTSTALGEAIGLVRRKVLMDVCTSLMLYLLASSTCQSHIYQLRHPSLCLL